MTDCNINDSTYIAHEMQIYMMDQEDKIYDKIMEKVSDKPIFRFCDGPPFVSSNTLHFGHILVSFIKDSMLRYLYANGNKCLNKMGFDCHGLPMEMVAYKELGLRTNSDVYNMGIDKFNEFCKNKVNEYVHSWYPIFTRISRLTDDKNRYTTMDKEFMESVWWIFNELWNKKLVSCEYEIMPYSIPCGTPLSNFEAGSAYKDIDTVSAYVLFPLKNDMNIKLVAWTTTPWTLPSNVALCVNPNAKYMLITDNKNNKYIIAENCIKGSKIKYETTSFYAYGKDLDGIEYIPPYEYIKRDKYRVITGDFVITEIENKENKEINIDGEHDTQASLGMGTGIVHIAPCYGKDDMDISLKTGIITLNEIEQCCTINDEGKYTDKVIKYVGINIHDANPLIIKELQENNRILRTQKMRHSYPHCPRTDTPLIYKAIKGYFIDVPQIGSELLANNDKVNWVPSHVGEKRFRNWIKTPKKWGVSRSRFFGTPIPIWQNQDGTERYCFGSISELVSACEPYNDKTKIDKLRKDIHLENIQDIIIMSKDGKTEMRHCGLVFDCWFESGAVPLAQYHYPFENKDCVDDRINEGYLVDFIAEGIDQTRGWFYTLMVLSTALFNKPAFKTVICSGLILAEDGRKFSKRYGNFKDPVEVINKYGADVIRLYLLSSSAVRAEPLLFSVPQIEQTKQKIIPWINGVKVYIEHKINYTKMGNIFDANAYLRTHNITDKWIMSRTRTLINEVSDKMKAYNIDNAVRTALGFIDEITNWYIKFNRDRLKGKNGKEEWMLSLSVLHNVHLNYIKLMLPFTPFLCEHLYGYLKDDSNKLIQLCEYPTGAEFEMDINMENEFRQMQNVVILIRKLRTKTKNFSSIRVPLKSATVIHYDSRFLDSIRKIEPLIKEELNILQFEYKLEQDYVSFKIIPNQKTLGQKYKGDANKIKQGMLKLTVAQLEDIYNGKTEINIDNNLITAEYYTVEKIIQFDKDSDEQITETDNGLTITINTIYDNEIEILYIMRMYFNHVQNMRKNAGLRPWDIIKLYMKETDNKLCEIIKNNKENCEIKLKTKLNLYDNQEIDLLYKSGYTSHQEQLNIDDRYRDVLIVLLWKK